MAAETAIIQSGSEVGIRDGRNQVNIVKQLVIYTANTVDAADTFTLTYANYGITTVLGVYGVKHTTDNSVIVAENPTTAVTSSVMTFTVPAGTDNDTRVAIVYYI